MASVSGVGLEAEAVLALGLKGVWEFRVQSSGLLVLEERGRSSSSSSRNRE